MVLRSMTGFGRGESTGERRAWTAEVRAVNNRFLDAKIKLPRDYASLEDELRKLIAHYHQRGRVDLQLTVSGTFSDLVEVRVDRDLAAAYRDALMQLADDLDLEPGLNGALIASYPDVITREQQPENLEEIRARIEEAATRALEDCREMREREAAALAEDLRKRMRRFAEMVDEVEERLPELQRLREANLKERLEKLLESTTTLEPMRLSQEVAILADKMDVTEEMVRIRSHLAQFGAILDPADEAVGRKLDFLIQEFLREVNTIASKINDAEIAHLTVNCKSELEKIREQVQNIE